MGIFFISKSNNNVETKIFDISLPKMQETFKKMEKEAGWDIKSPLIWGYFFLDHDNRKLELFAKKLQEEGFKIVDIRKTEDGIFNLHIEEKIVHSPESLYNTSRKLAKLANENHIETFDGWDAGIDTKSPSSVTDDKKPTAYPLNYSGKGIWNKAFKNYNFGVVFEDDGKTGYFYATNKGQTVIFDALQLYDYNSKDKPKSGEKMYIVLNESLKKAGIYYQNKFHAVFDFNNERGSNLLNSPKLKTAKWEKPHIWDDAITEGLNP